MENKAKSKKRFLIIAICAVIAIAVALLFMPMFRQIYYKIQVKGYYKDNKETFQLFVDEFKKLYSNGIKSISYTDKYGFLLNLDDKQDKIGTDSPICRTVADGLKKLKDKYQQNSDLRVFTYVSACFDDNGNMLLYLSVKGSKPFRKSNDSDEYRTCWYLIYIDDDYKGSGSPFAIDSFISESGVREKPFEDNWHIWWQDERTC